MTGDRLEPDAIGYPVGMSATPPIRVLVAFDGSDAACSAVAGAGRLFPGAEAIVLNVYTVAVLAGSSVVPAMAGAALATATFEETTEAEERIRKEALRLAEAGAAAATKSGLQARAEVRPGSGGSAGVWSSILDAAKDADADAIVVGSRGHSVVRSVLLGSVSDGVVHHADRAVVVVREPAHD